MNSSDVLSDPSCSTTENTSVLFSLERASLRQLPFPYASCKPLLSKRYCTARTTHSNVTMWQNLCAACTVCVEHACIRHSFSKLSLHFTMIWLFASQFITKPGLPRISRFAAKFCLKPLLILWLRSRQRSSTLSSALLKASRTYQLSAVPGGRCPAPLFFPPAADMASQVCAFCLSHTIFCRRVVRCKMCARKMTEEVHGWPAGVMLCRHGTWALRL